MEETKIICMLLSHHTDHQLRFLSIDRTVTQMLYQAFAETVFYFSMVSWFYYTEMTLTHLTEN